MLYDGGRMYIRLRGWMRDEDKTGEPSCYFVLRRRPDGDWETPSIGYSLCAGYVTSRIDLLVPTVKNRCPRCQEIIRTAHTEQDFKRLSDAAKLKFDTAVDRGLARQRRRDEKLRREEDDRREARRERHRQWKASR